MSTAARAVIFDMDGLLIDSEPLWQQAEIEVLGGLGVHLDHELCRTMQGVRVDEVIAHWHRSFPWDGVSIGEARDRVVERVVELVLERGQLQRGAMQAIACARRRAGHVALASSSPYRLIEAVISRFDLAGAFDVVRSAADEPFGKPHPAVYLHAAEQLDVPCTACVAVEDSVTGVIAAKAARMRCVAVPDPPHLLGDPRYSIADAVLATLDELEATLDRLLG